MVTVDPNCADPSIANSYKVYEDILPSSGTYGSGTGSRYTIRTTIRSRIYVQAQAIKYNAGTGVLEEVFQIPYAVTLDDASLLYSVTIDVPDGCEGYYRIVGYVNTDALLPSRDYREDPTGIVMDLSTIHNHDGVNSPQIPYSSISGLPNLGTVQWIPFKVPNTGAYGYDTNYGQEGIVVYVPDSPNWARITYLTYNTNDGAGNHQKGQTLFAVAPPVESLTIGDRIALRFWDDGGTDKLSIYKNGSLYYTIPNPPTPHPGAGVNQVYVLGIKFQTTF